MFGMDKNKKNQAQKTTFNLEENLKGNPQKKKEITDNAAEKIETLKKMLRAGKSDQKEYDQIAFLLHGYNALIKVVNRIK